MGNQIIILMVSSKGKMDGNMERQECNGYVDGTEVEKVIEGKNNGETVSSHWKIIEKLIDRRKACERKWIGMNLNLSLY